MPAHYGMRKPVKKRETPGMTMQKAVIDTTGMDPEMKETLLGMRGALGAGKPAKKKKSGGFFDFIKGLFGG